MCAPTDYCRIHGYQPCQCTGANVQPQQQSVPRRQQRRRGTASTSSYSQSSPQDTSSSGTAANTVDPTRRSTPVVVSAFSPLAQSLERYKGSDSGCGTQDPADEEIRRTDLSQSSLRPTPQNRFQLLQRFIDLHMGTSGRARVIFQYETIQTGEPGTVTTTAAMDTLCIAQLATSFGDNQLKKESKLMYSRAMRLLGMKIQSFGGAKPSPEQLDDVIGAIHALTASSWFRCVDAGGLDWTRHAQALLRVLNVSKSGGMWREDTNS